MRIECIAVGTELLVTGRLDTNSVWISERLGRMGFAPHRKSVVGDDPGDLRALFTEAVHRSELVICTGGLGPTFDDLTKEIWAEVFGTPLAEDAQVRRDILDFHAARHRVPPESNFKQALVPVGASILRNPAGTAPGLLWESPAGFPGCRVVLLPGVPREMKEIWEGQVEPVLAPLAGAPVHTLRMVVGSVPESALDERTRMLRERHGDLSWTILAGLSHVELVAKGSDPGHLEQALGEFRELLGPDLVCAGEGSIESTVLECLRQRGETLALAESVTGGQIAAKLVAVPGASDVLLGGGVVYSPAAKYRLAAVPAELLAAHGTVAEATTRAMAEGIRASLGATWALATTGNAGPSGDRHGDAPVGTIHMAVAGPGGTCAITHVLPGFRGDVQARAASWALDFLRRQLI
nr:CinA family nicotinamide mononucleotide deamidase-related protein [uncultured Holophaga sp.]